MTRRMIVFSDLDGTLLDHETYSFEPARPALDRLKREGHVLVLASSKTAAEIAPLRDAMGFSHCPAIVENGAGILAAGEGVKGDGPTRHDEILQALSTLPESARPAEASKSAGPERVVPKLISGQSGIISRQSSIRSS